MSSSRSVFVLATFSVAGLGACRTSPSLVLVPPPVVARLPAGLEGDLASRAARDCLVAAQRFRADRGRLPVIKLHPVRNQSSLGFDGNLYQQQLEAALVRAGGVVLAGSADELYTERRDQAENASSSTVKSARPLPPDFVLTGWLVGGLSSASLVMQLLSVETSAKVWMRIYALPA